jgi:serine protease AprX
MTIYRVKVFFMHENELDVAKQAEFAKIITDTEWAEGYVIGLIDESHVAGLAKQGLIITPIERVEIVKRPSGSRSRSGARRVARAARSAGQRPGRLETSIVGKSDDQKILSRDLANPQFYVVRLTGPLTPSRSSALKQDTIELLERPSRSPPLNKAFPCWRTPELSLTASTR